MSCLTDFLKGAGSKVKVACSAVYSSGYSAPTDTDGYIMPFTSESFNPTGETVSSNAIVGGRTVLDQEVLNTVMDGNFDVELAYENWDYILFMVTGASPLTETDLAGFEGTGETDGAVAPANHLPKYDVW